MKKNKKRPYIINALLVLAIFSFIFISKGIFPFGKNSLIWGDMHDQITAFYYHFYDSFRGTSSLFVNFTTSGGINFFGILCYYILSPITFILLLFPREDIYLAVSIVVALKILLSSLTCLYFIKSYYKKLPSSLSIFLALCYAFSGYSLSMYQITPWFDIMYLFPLLMIGLKKLLDLEKPIWYIVILTTSLVCNFYVSIMVIIFVFLSSYIYLLIYKEKEERRKGILSLGLSTILSVLISAVVLIPSYMQISVSSRLNSRLIEMLNSKTGPLTDKLSFFMFGGIVYLGIIFLIKYYKKDSKFSLWYLANFLIVGIPIIVEPINKVWHFGSYAFFPYRFGFITIFLLILGACYGYTLITEHEKKIKAKNHNLPLVAGGISLISSIVIIYLTKRNYASFQIKLDQLSISGNHKLLIFLVFTTMLSIACCYLIYRFTTSWNKTRTALMALVLLTHITSNSFLYFGIDFTQKELMGQYESLLEISKTYPKGEYYRVKNLSEKFIMNSGMVMKYHTLDHFTSLTDRNNMQNLKRLGYSSSWVKTFSKGGTLFSDTILGNHYVMSTDTVNDPYYQIVGTYKDVNLYEHKVKSSYGYLIHEDINTKNSKNSFEIQNQMYQKIENTADSIFTTFNQWKLNNIKKSKKNEKTSYQIIDEDAYNYIEQTISVGKKKVLYLEILKDLDNNINLDIYQHFNIYVNDRLFQDHAITEDDNGVINLGTFEQEDVNVKIELIWDVEVDNITLATMDLEKYESFIKNNQVPLEMEYKKNKITIKVDSKEKQTLFIPVSYNEGYQGKINHKKIQVEKVFDNFLGIPLEEGMNEITLTFTPPGFKLSLVISLLALVFTIFLLRKDYYHKLLELKPLQTVANICYLSIYTAFILLVYIGLTIVFILSYFIYFGL